MQILSIKVISTKPTDRQTDSESLMHTDPDMHSVICQSLVLAA